MKCQLSSQQITLAWLFVELRLYQITMGILLQLTFRFQFVLQHGFEFEYIIYDNKNLGIQIFA